MSKGEVPVCTYPHPPRLRRLQQSENASKRARSVRLFFLGRSYEAGRKSQRTFETNLGTRLYESS